MPFFEPWNKKPQPRDLVYGLKLERQRFCDVYFSASSQMSLYRAVTSIDEYTCSPEELKSEGLMRFLVPQRFHRMSSDVTVRTNNTVAARQARDEERAQAAVRERDLANEVFLEHLSQHPKYKDIVGWMPASARKSDMQCLQGEVNVSDNQGERHRGKGGLSWATSKSESGRHVHFLLDRLSMGDVVHKSDEADNPPGPVPKKFDVGKKSRDTIGSELRWIYRERRRPEVQASVQFWLNLKPCAPPWVQPERWALLWVQYRPSKRGGRFSPLWHLFGRR